MKPLHVIAQGTLMEKALAIVEEIAAPRYFLQYRLHGRIGATTPEPAEGAMKDRNVLLGMGATDVEVRVVRP